MTELAPDEQRILDAYRRVRDRKFGDLEISVAKGSLVKLFEIVKHKVVDFPLRETKTTAEL